MFDLITTHFQFTMAQQQQQEENAPAQNLPLVALGEFLPPNYKVTIGNNNPRIDFNKLSIPEDSSRIVKDILLVHPCKDMLTKSASVPTFYLHQFWHTAQVNLDDASFKVTLERQEYNIDLDVLREVLMLPVHKEHAPILAELEVLDYMIELGYDLGDARQQMTLSSFNVKFLPQPWRTFYMLIIRSISGRKSGHEHPRATHLQVF